MRRERLCVALVASAVLAPPLLGPLGLVLREPSAWQVWTDWGRLSSLALNTLALVAGTLLLCLPAGIALAAILYRTDLPFRRLIRTLLLVLLFIPWPLLAAGWQAVLGTRAGTSGLAPAILLHALAGLPWVVLIVGQGLAWVERELEEDAATATSPPRVFWKVTLPRAAPAIAAAALWVALQAAGEITFTDLFQVRTYAEETYTQFVAPEPDDWRPGDALARAVAVALPPALGLMLVLLLATLHWQRRLPSAESWQSPLRFPLGRWRWPTGMALAALVLAAAGAPVVGLVLRAGSAAGVAGWSGTTLLRQLAGGLRADGELLAGGLLLAGVAGGMTASLALALCWSTRDSPRIWIALLPALALTWALPGPVLGLGLKTTIAALLDWTRSRWLENVLYQGPSPFPLLWIDVVRFLPCAVAIVWPVTRIVSRDLCEAARIDGAGPLAVFASVVWPATRRAWAMSALAVGVLALGEVSAGKLVSTPGWPSYGEVLFQRLHYGVTPDLAAGCLMLLAMVAAGAAALGSLGRIDGER